MGAAGLRRALVPGWAEEVKKEGERGMKENIVGTILTTVHTHICIDVGFERFHPPNGLEKARRMERWDGAMTGATWTNRKRS